MATRLGALLRRLLTYDSGEHLRAIEASGLTLTQCKVLLLLAGDEGGDAPTSGKDLARELGLSLPAVSRSVDGLVRDRLATRAEDPEDRRVRRIAITAKGTRFADQLIQTRIASLEAFVSSLTPAQRRKLDTALSSLLEREDIAALHKAMRVGARR